ncbi:hypothetical protein VTJ04DRAFT_5140 [Mycothermus thermophilus]|uniref:uncharacterized protein n=1 Tax=Humicola insolens TaxID=85995 RepID=UPI0037439362
MDAAKSTAVPRDEELSSVPPLTPASDTMTSSGSRPSSWISSEPAFAAPFLDETMWSYFCAERSVSGLHANAVANLSPWPTPGSTTPSLEQPPSAVPAVTSSWAPQAAGLVSPAISSPDRQPIQLGLQPGLMLSHLNAGGAGVPGRIRTSWSSEESIATAFSPITPDTTTTTREDLLLEEPALKRIKTEPSSHQPQPAVVRRPNISLRTAARKKKPTKSSSAASPTNRSVTTTTTTATSPSPSSSSSTTTKASTTNEDDATKASEEVVEAEEEEEDDGLTPEERRARHNHNLVEKHYRRRLNVQFARLLDALMLPVPPARAPTIESATRVKRGRGGGSSSSSGGGAGKGGGGYVKGCGADGDEDEGFGGGSSCGLVDEKRISKAEVLELAARRIRELEREKEKLVRERKELVRNIEVLMMAGAVGRAVF